MNAHADMFIVVEYNELNTPRGIYRSLVSGERNFAGFLLTKTSTNKRLLLYVCQTDCSALLCKGSELF